MTIPAQADAVSRIRLVIVESPYAGDVERNTAYARACLADSLRRGEAPFASHLLYTQPGVLDDQVPEERTLGIKAGLAWGVAAHATVVYLDHGITPGMRHGIDRAASEGRPIELRYIGKTDSKHSPAGLRERLPRNINGGTAHHPARTSQPLENEHDH